MKHFILFSVTLLLFFNSVFSQTPPRRDTLFGASYYTGMLNAECITGETEPVTIVPNVGPFCFNRSMSVKLSGNTFDVSECLYLDTKKGLVAWLKSEETTGSVLCDIIEDDPDFTFMVSGLAGNAYFYFNRQPGTTVQHFVRTGNTTDYKIQLQTNDSLGGHTLVKKHITGRYLEYDTIKAEAYKFDGDSKVYYLFGNGYPENLVWEKYMGNFGVGYLNTDQGLYVIMEMEDGDNSYRVTYLENFEYCFDPAPFVIEEDTFYTKRREDLLREKIKLDQELAKSSQGDCASERQTLAQFKEDQWGIQMSNLERSRIGNIYQNNQTQQAIIGTYDPLVMVEQNILETKVGICRSDLSLDRHPDSESEAERIGCLRSYLGFLITAEAQMKALDITYADTPGRAMTEKSRIYLDVMRHSCR